jgi:excisionase family DNA binding protein
MDELLTLAEAARVLRLAVSTLRSWRLQGKFLTFRKIGGRVLIHRDDLARLIERSAEGC